VKLTRRAACRLVLHGLAGASASLFLEGRAEAANRTKPQFQFSESYARKVVRVVEPDGTKVFEPVESGKFSLTARLPLDEIDPSTFNADTALTIELEEVIFDLLLGDDPAYTAGRTSANISFSEVGGDGLPVVYLSFQIRWNTKSLTIKAHGLTPDFQEPILAGYYLDDFSQRYGDTSEAAITVDDGTYYFDVDYSGRVVTQTVVRGPDREEFDVSSTSLKAIGHDGGFDRLGRRSRRQAGKP
jgi:hypothetical protein